MRDYVTPELMAEAEELGINREQIRVRMTRGWSAAESCRTPIRSKKKLPQAWVRRAAANGIDKETLRRRLTRGDGWSLEDACTIPEGTRRLRRSPKLEFTREQLNIMHRNGLSPRLVKQRVNELNWRLIDAITTPKLKKTDRRTGGLKG